MGKQGQSERENARQLCVVSPFRHCVSEVAAWSLTRNGYRERTSAISCIESKNFAACFSLSAFASSTPSCWSVCTSRECTPGCPGDPFARAPLAGG